MELQYSASGYVSNYKIYGRARCSRDGREEELTSSETYNGFCAIGNKQGSRPKSGKVRPLSGRVFIRRTVKNGWVAKGFHGNQLNLEGEDEEWEKSSLDSFFDDDFESQSTGEVLGNLLSCSTLGTESKGHRPDWNVGGLSTQEFHCPRCRDHWYGLSSFPCDEELARLIREGLWYTGKGNPKKRVQGAKDEYGSSIDGEKSKSSYSNMQHDLPNISSKASGFRTKKSEHSIDFIDPSPGKKKSKKRIMFRIEGEDSDDDGMQSGSSNRLLGDWKERSGSRGRGDGKNNDAISSQQLDTLGLGSFRSTKKNGRDGRNDDTSSSTSDLNSGSSTNMLHSRGEGILENGSHRSKSGKGRRRSGVNGEGDTLGRTEDKGSDLLARQKFKGRKATEAWGEKNSTDTQGEGTDVNWLSTDGKDQQRSRSEQAGKTTHNGTGDNGSDSKQDKTGDSTYSQRRNQSSSLSSSKASSRTSLHGSQGSRGGREQTDGGKGPVGKGYMRVASTSNQAWGNPTHALPWASNTASSSRVSLTHSTGHHDEINGDNDEEWAVSLPPIPPSQDMSNIFGFPAGFQLTRAFTFSYH